MRKLIGFAFVIAAFAGDTNPMLQSWKLNAEKSTIDGALPTFIHNGYMRPRPSAAHRPMPYDKTQPISIIYGSGNQQTLYQGTVSADGRVLKLTEHGPHHSVLVLDVQ